MNDSFFAVLVERSATSGRIIFPPFLLFLGSLSLTSGSETSPLDPNLNLDMVFERPRSCKSDLYPQARRSEAIPN